jgi:flagellin
VRNFRTGEFAPGGHWACLSTEGLTQFTALPKGKVLFVGGYMGLRINTNVSSINAQRQLSTQQKRNEHAMASLSSGSRIVKAADDAAGLAISQNIKGQDRGIKQARTNEFNAISLIQVSEGGLNEINNILIRLRELGVQAASDTVGEVERGFLNQEARQLVTEADRIAKTTRFGNRTLLDGSGEELQFHVGPFGDENNIIRYELKADATGSTIGYDGISVADKDSAREALQTVDEALIKLGNLRADFGAVQSRMDTTVSNLDIQHENLSAAYSRLSDADVAYESSEMVSSQILQQAAVGVLAQANQQGALAMRLLA